MGKQYVKVFYCGRYLDYPLVTEFIEDQLNRYLQENPQHRIYTINTIVGNGYKLAFVVFEIIEPRDKQNYEKQKNKEAYRK